jgi:hypothetical protein
MATLTSSVTGLVNNAATTVNLSDWGAAGAATIDDTNFTATSDIWFFGFFTANG